MGENFSSALFGLKADRTRRWAGAETVLPDVLFGFRKGSRTQAARRVKQLMKEIIESNGKFFACFVNLKQAYYQPAKTHQKVSAAGFHKQNCKSTWDAVSKKQSAIYRRGHTQSETQTDRRTSTG